MSIEAMSGVWKNSKQEGTSLLVLLAMADYANEDAICWPSVSNLAQKARTSRRTVQRVLRSLEECGEIAEMESGGWVQGTNKSGRYRLNLGGGDKLTPHDTGDAPGVTQLCHDRGDIAMAHNPSSYPSDDPSRYNSKGDGDSKSKASNGKHSPSRPIPPKSQKENSAKEKARPTDSAAVEAYAVERGLPATDGEFVFDTWTANGFKLGKNPILDWKAAFRTRQQMGWLPSLGHGAALQKIISANDSAPKTPPQDGGEYGSDNPAYDRTNPLEAYFDGKNWFMDGMVMYYGQSDIQQILARKRAAIAERNATK